MSDSRVILAAAMVACLAACDSDAPGSGAAVSNVQLPHPKAGLWRWSTRSAGERQVCLSGRLLSAFSPHPGCPTTRQVRLGDGSFVAEATCPSGPALHSEIRAQGDYTRGFTVDVRLGDFQDHSDYRYLGPCPPGRRPDDQPS